MSTPAWWLDGLTVTLMREGVSKHRAKEIAIGYWEAYCEDEAGQVEQYKQDAERYQWLRQQTWDESEIACVMFPKAAVKLGHDCPSHERLDEMIAAIRARAQEE